MLKETLSQTDLLELPMFAFVFFMLVFALIVVRVLLRGRKDPHYETLAALPLIDDADAREVER